MATSPFSASLRSRPGGVARPRSATLSPTFPTLPQVPQVPAIDDARAPGAPQRSFLLGQLPSLAQQHQARLTGIQAQAKLGLAGYGGYQFGKDDPATGRREDLDLSFDPNAGPGERGKQAIRQGVNEANARGLLYSSIANQNIASQLQRLSLEAQQVATQYSGTLNQEFTGYAGQVANVIGEYTSLYGQDAAFLVENPPPPTPTAYEQAVSRTGQGQLAVSRQGEPIVGRWESGDPQRLMELMRARYPGAAVDIRPMGGGGWVAVLRGEAM